MAGPAALGKTEALLLVGVTSPLRLLTSGQNALWPDLNIYDPKDILSFFEGCSGGVR